ncbi:MAG TPA: hypothetical protein DCO75_13120, partial [Fibrobacteres bacterium]|nr:hypothetical protein [Fibrobacterota bacterium]
IEAIALPSGSARIKKESSFNVALNAYCGFFAGWNLKDGVDYATYGITAPVGVSISWGIHHNAISVFASIIDLGAIASYRFVNDSTISTKIYLKDIISPGVFLAWGMPWVPFSLNIGGEFTPLLTSVSSSTNDIESKVFRLSVNLCVDIPILNFYNSN